MWDFMKPKPKPLSPVCPAQPAHQTIKELEAYRLYIIKNINCVYEKILEELSVTDPDSLAKLNEVINEYKEIESSIDAKLSQMSEMLNSFIETYKADSVEDLRLYYDYDVRTKNLSYRIGKKEE